MATVQFLVSCTAFCLFFLLRDPGSHLFKAPGMLPLALLVGWMFVQFLPLPSPVVKLINPAMHEIYSPVQEVSGRGLWTPLTVNQKTTFFECMRFASYALFYFLTVQILSNGKRLKRTVSMVTYLAIFIAVLAIIQKFSSPDKIYWFRSTPINAGTVGPWVYHNHYAGFMEMMCPLVLALFLFYRPSVAPSEPLRSRVAAVFSMPGSNLHFFLGFGAIIIITSIFVSLSRGGIISLSLALALFVALLPGKMFNTRVSTYAFLAACVALMVTWLGWSTLIEKFGTTFTTGGNIYDIRLTLWEDSLRIVHDFFLAGTGFGTFINIYPLYSTVTTDFILDHAHNDYLELLTDGGIIGFTLAGWFVATIIAHGWRSIRSRRDRYAILLSIGSLTGIVSILLHSVTDFNMYNGANGLYFFFLCGLLVSAGSTRIYYRTRPTILDRAGSRTRMLLFVAALLLVSSAIIARGGAMLASVNYTKVANTYLSRSLHQEKVQAVAATAQRSSRYDPLEGKYLFALGSAQVFLNRLEDARASLIRASEKNPLSGTYLQKLALLVSIEDKPLAENLMAAAYTRALNKDYLVLTWAEWLLSVNEREKAVKMLRQVFSRRPQLVEKFLPVLAVYSFDRLEFVAMLPDSVGAWAHSGDLAEKLGNIADAEFYRSHALDFLDREEVLEPWYFSQLYWFYYRQEKSEQAVNVLRLATERMPEHAEFHVYLGDHYKREGVLYRAQEEYEQALLLDPADEKTREKLEELQQR